MRRVALFSRSLSSDARPHIEHLIRLLGQREAELCLHTEVLNMAPTPEDDRLSWNRWEKPQELSKFNPELLIALGGDGTMLDAAALIGSTGIPVLGINLGRLGFLADVAKGEVRIALDDYFEGRYSRVERTMLHMQSGLDPHPQPRHALNEIAVSRKESTSMVTVYAYIDGVFLNAYWADGLIVSTPTGSTGYSLSCGGPILMPEAQNFVITPIAPHNLNVRPFVIPDDCEIRLKVESREPQFLVSLDSRVYSAQSGSELCIRKAEFSFASIRTERQSFAQTLRSKLFWGADRRN